MKKILCLALALLSLFAMVSPALAAEADPGILSVTYFEDGSYLVTTLEESNPLSRSTKNSNKYYRYYNASNVLEWRMVLVASFTYDGTTSTCIAAGCNVDIYDTSRWSLISESESRIDNTAYGFATLGDLRLGATADQKSYTLMITCDKNGNCT